MKTTSIVTWTALLFGAIAAHAQPTIFFGEDVSPYPDGPNNCPRPTGLANTFAAAALFAAHLPGVLAESFEAYARDSSPTNIAFGTNIATLSGSREVVTVSDPAATSYGAFPISGTNMLRLPAATSLLLTLDFSAPQAAFGFFGTDFGESATMRLTFIAANAAKTEVDVPVTRPQGSGGAFFCGVIDKRAPFTRVEFRRMLASDDGFGFDDFTIATPEQVAPPRLSVRRSGFAEVELSWATLTNELYTLDWQPGLTGEAWSTLQCVAGDGKTKRIYDQIGPAEARRFYRLALTNCVPGP